MTTRLIAIAAWCVILATVKAQPATTFARAASVTGQVVLSNGGGAPAFALTRGYALNPGDQVDTRGGGRVSIELSDGSMVIVEPETVLRIKDFRAAASLRELFEIAIGLVRVKINRFTGRPNPYRMNSPTASIAVRGTEFTVSVEPSGNTNVVVLEGLVEVAILSDPGRSVLLEGGQGVWVRPGELFGMNGARAPGRELAQRDARERAPTGRDLDDARRGPGNGGPHPDHASQTAAATAYSRYVAGLSGAGYSPFLWRFNAFADAHLDSLENPAYAAGFQSAEARLFLAPTWNSAGNGVFPQISIFAPVAGGFVAGGKFVGSHTANGTLTSAALLAGGRLGGDGRNSAGFSFEKLNGAFSDSSLQSTRIAAGFSRDLSRGRELGVFFRYGWIDAAETNSSRSAGHTSEAGLRLRGPLTPKLSYGVTANWLGIGVADSMKDRQQRDRGQRVSAGFGIGYLLGRATMISVDLTGGVSHLRTASFPQTGQLVQRFFSVHGAMQRDVTRRLFAGASILAVAGTQSQNLAAYSADRFLYPAAAAFIPGARYSDFFLGWRFSPAWSAQYVYSTEYAARSGSHSVMLRYILRRRHD